MAEPPISRALLAVTTWSVISLYPVTATQEFMLTNVCLVNHHGGFGRNRDISPSVILEDPV